MQHTRQGQDEDKVENTKRMPLFTPKRLDEDGTRKSKHAS